MKKKNEKNRNKNENEKNQISFHAVTLRSFVSFLKTLLEDVSMLSESHLRSIFRIIFQCTCVAEEPYSNNNNNNNNNDNTNNNDNNNAIEKDVQWSFKPPDDVMILLKKFSGSVNISLRRISIIGYVAYLSELRAFCCSFQIEDTTRMSGSDKAEDEDEAGAREGRGESNAVNDVNNNQDQNKEESVGLEEEGIKVLNMMVSSVTDDTAGLVFLVSGEVGEEKKEEE